MKANAIDPVSCPACGKAVEPSGSLFASGADHPVFQCPDCTSPLTVEGQTFQAAVTWIMLRGKPYDPASPDDPCWAHVGNAK